MRLSSLPGRALVTIALAAAGLGAAPMAAQAQSVQFVPCTGTNGGASGLIDAINTVGSGSGVIELAEDCTYTFTSAFTGTTALPEITGRIVITGDNSTIARAANATEAFRLAQVNEGASLTLVGTTIRNGNVSDIGSVGGGIVNLGTLSLKFSKVVHNQAIEVGGGIYNGGLLLLHHTVISDNRSGSGGGIYSFGTVRAVGSVITGNTAVNGAGLRNDEGSAQLVKSVVENNIAATGAGIDNGGTLQVKESKISGNRATGSAEFLGNGGGLLNRLNATAEITDSLITRNIAADNGGGIFNDGSVTLIRTLVILNQPNDCAGGNPIAQCSTV